MAVTTAQQTHARPVEAADGTAAATSTRPKVVVVNAGPSFGEYGERQLLEAVDAEIALVAAHDEDELIAACRDADAVVGLHRISKRFIGSLERCRIIARASIGMDTVEDVDACTAKGIVLSNTPDIFVDEVANHTMALLLACARWVVQFATHVREGGWGRARSTIGYVPHIGGETLGLVGFGNIARAVARRAQAFDLDVIAYDPYVQPDDFHRHGVTRSTLGAVLQDSDFISLHVPLLPETRHLISRPQFALMKPTAMLVNTCRGPVVDESALIEALEQRRIAAAGLDVIEREPIDPENPLLRLPNVIITPHAASMSDPASIRRRRVRPFQEAAALLTGHRPRAVYNPAVLATLDLR